MGVLCHAYMLSTCISGRPNYISNIPGPGTPLFPGLGSRCAVPNVMVPGYAAVDSGC